MNQAPTPDRILGVETGGCPHTAIREDASINLEAVDRLNRRFPSLEVIFIESGLLKVPEPACVPSQAASPS